MSLCTGFARNLVIVTLSVWWSCIPGYSSPRAISARSLLTSSQLWLAMEDLSCDKKHIGDLRYTKLRRENLQPYLKGLTFTSHG